MCDFIAPIRKVMLTVSAKFSDFSIEIFSSEGTEHPNQDRWIMHQTGVNSMRAGVIDGVTPWRSAPTLGGDAAQFAASIVLSRLSLPVTLEEAFKLSNRELHDVALTPLARQSMAASAAVDISYSMGWIVTTGIVAADCEIWTSDKPAASAHLLVGGEARKSEKVKEHQSRLAREPRGNDWDSQRLRESEDFSRPDDYSRHAVGFCEKPRFSVGQGKFNNIILATGGARLSDAPRVNADPEALWLWLDKVEDASPREDFTVMSITLK